MGLGGGNQGSGSPLGGNGGEIVDSWIQVCAAARPAREKWVTGWSVGDCAAGPTVAAGGPAGP